MAIVVKSGDVTVGDAIAMELPAGVHRPLLPPVCHLGKRPCGSPVRVVSGHLSTMTAPRSSLSIARRRVGQVQPEDDLVLVVEAEALAGGLELCAARVLGTRPRNLGGR